VGGGERVKGLLVDYGGVLTTNLFGSFAAFCADEGLDPQALRHAFAGDREAAKLLVKFEKGVVGEEEFEAALAGKLGVAPERLIDRLFAKMQPEPLVIEAVAAAKRYGVRCGLLSNSWGHRYDRTRWEELFDATVISGEIGMRKPDPGIYALAAEKLGVAPKAIVFVDDIPHNLTPAEELGMATVHHTDPEKTVAELERLLELELR
jgi:epoxide hydrolase-like predicted phosphatase